MLKHQNGPFTNLETFVLASGSPRRKELLYDLGLDCIIHPSQLDEPAPEPHETPKQYAKRMAEMKTRDVATHFPNHPTLGADTIVALGQKIMGKPKDKADALAKLRQLSGNTHQVISAFSLLLPGGTIITQAVSTDVDMRRSTDAELTGYIDTGEPMDKAGAYAIQGIGTFLVKAISGSYTNVVGLPVTEVVDLLTSQGVIAPAHD